MAKNKEFSLKNLIVKASFLFLASVPLALTPLQTEASFLAFLTPDAEAQDQATPHVNAQTMMLPEPIPMQGTIKKVLLATEDGALIPQTNPLGADADLQDLPETDMVFTYTVHKGDTVAQIAKMFGISSLTVRSANNLGANDKVSEGDVLTILPVDGISYKVRKGDTLKGIANQFKANLDDIKRFNGLEGDSDLVVGDVLIVPDGQIAAPKKSSGSSLNSTSSSGGGKLLPLLARGPTRLIKGYDGPDLGDYFIRPVRGGYRSQGLHGDNGIDIAAPIGTPILAAADGVVITARNSGFNGGYGKYVKIKHPNGTITVYAHMSQVLVTEGQSVAQGGTIGLMGRTGLATGSHVHFEVRGAKNPLGDNPKYGL